MGHRALSEGNPWQNPVLENRPASACPMHIRGCCGTLCGTRRRSIECWTNLWPFSRCSGGNSSEWLCPLLHQTPLLVECPDELVIMCACLALCVPDIRP